MEFSDDQGLATERLALARFFKENGVLTHTVVLTGDGDRHVEKNPAWVIARIITSI